ncbi:MAG: hypothetical protein CL489_00045 [Acidobacteria bacterium]|nr:hypothetical protein [Acidobacteriota bacterium]
MNQQPMGYSMNSPEVNGFNETTTDEAEQPQELELLRQELAAMKESQAQLQGALQAMMSQSDVKGEVANEEAEEENKPIPLKVVDALKKVIDAGSSSINVDDLTEVADAIMQDVDLKIADKFTLQNLAPFVNEQVGVLGEEHSVQQTKVDAVNKEFSDFVERKARQLGLSDEEMSLKYQPILDKFLTEQQYRSAGNPEEAAGLMKSQIEWQEQLLNGFSPTATKSPAENNRSSYVNPNVAKASDGRSVTRWPTEEEARQVFVEQATKPSIIG